VARKNTHAFLKLIKTTICLFYNESETGYITNIQIILIGTDVR